MDVTPFLLNGRWVTTDSTAPVQNPHTGETIALVCQADRANLDDAVAGAERAFRDTRAMPRHQRAALLTQVAAALAAQKPELSRLMATEAGKPLQFAAGEVDRAVATFTVAAEEAKRLSGEWLPTDWTSDGEASRWDRSRRSRRSISRSIWSPTRSRRASRRATRWSSSRRPRRR
jgi:glyceraldehyde-3-phosphate dehydrogenase (NADP+)